MSAEPDLHASGPQDLYVFDERPAETGSDVADRRSHNRTRSSGFWRKLGLVTFHYDSLLPWKRKQKRWCVIDQHSVAIFQDQDAFYQQRPPLTVFAIDKQLEVRRYTTDKRGLQDSRFFDIVHSEPKGPETVYVVSVSTLQEKYEWLEAFDDVLAKRNKSDDAFVFATPRNVPGAYQEYWLHPRRLHGVGTSNAVEAPQPPPTESQSAPSTVGAKEEAKDGPHTGRWERFRSRLSRSNTTLSPSHSSSNGPTTDGSSSTLSLHNATVNSAPRSSLSSTPTPTSNAAAMDEAHSAHSSNRSPLVPVRQATLSSSTRQSSYSASPLAPSTPHTVPTSAPSSATSGRSIPSSHSLSARHSSSKPHSAGGAHLGSVYEPHVTNSNDSVPDDQVADPDANLPQHSPPNRSTPRQLRASAAQPSRSNNPSPGSASLSTASQSDIKRRSSLGTAVLTRSARGASKPSADSTHSPSASSPGMPSGARDKQGSSPSDSRISAPNSAPPRPEPATSTVSPHSSVASVPLPIATQFRKSSRSPPGKRNEPDPADRSAEVSFMNASKIVTSAIRISRENSVSTLSQHRVRRSDTEETLSTFSVETDDPLYHFTPAAQTPASYLRGDTSPIQGVTPEGQKSAEFTFPAIIETDHDTDAPANGGTLLILTKSTPRMRALTTSSLPPPMSDIPVHPVPSPSPPPIVDHHSHHDDDRAQLTAVLSNSSPRLSLDAPRSASPHLGPSEPKSYALVASSSGLRPYPSAPPTGSDLRRSSPPVSDTAGRNTPDASIESSAHPPTLTRRESERRPRQKPPRDPVGAYAAQLLSTASQSSASPRDFQITVTAPRPSRMSSAPAPLRSSSPVLQQPDMIDSPHRGVRSVPEYPLDSQQRAYPNQSHQPSYAAVASRRSHMNRPRLTSDDRSRSFDYSPEDYDSSHTPTPLRDDSPSDTASPDSGENANTPIQSNVRAAMQALHRSAPTIRSVAPPPPRAEPPPVNRPSPSNSSDSRQTLSSMRKARLPPSVTMLPPPSLRPGRAAPAPAPAPAPQPATKVGWASPVAHLSATPTPLSGSEDSSHGEPPLLNWRSAYGDDLHSSADEDPNHGAATRVRPIPRPHPSNRHPNNARRDSETGTVSEYEQPVVQSRVHRSSSYSQAVIRSTGPTGPSSRRQSHGPSASEHYRAHSHQAPPPPQEEIITPPARQDSELENFLSPPRYYNVRSTPQSNGQPHHSRNRSTPSAPTAVMALLHGDTGSPSGSPSPSPSPSGVSTDFGASPAKAHTILQARMRGQREQRADSVQLSHPPISSSINSSHSRPSAHRSKGHRK